MDRKDFLKTLTLAGIGSPFLLNGMPSRFMNQFADFSLSCDEVNDRCLVILRMAGANDGLNTVIPISQYDTYANLRPNIKIANTGAAGYISLDSTVTQDKMVGLNPNMSGFKTLYDSGKLTLFNGVGYPNPNYSHFRSENLMFSGKDGSVNQDLTDGIFGRYLGALYPGLAGNPTTQNPDPLAIQLGNLNPCLFYEHNVEKNIEYNVTGFQTNLFNSLKVASAQQLITPSEYNDLLNYIKGVEVSMDSYYNRVMSVFNAGNNSTVTYPNSTLGKQLKTVARLIKGGSKTKIFQVNVGSFDTHVNQVQSGSTNLGTHANLLGDIANSILAFQNDMENLGISNKVLTVSFSEFGRQVKENASLGTDHGDLAPFFVIGNNISGGIMGSHPVFTNATSFYYNQTERKFDYRQIFASLLQDWLGADTGLINASELQNFVTPTTKVNIVAPNKTASVVCANALNVTEVNTKNKILLYPNPADSFITVDFGTLNANNSHIQIFDISGRKLIELQNNSSVQRIPLDNFKNGIYIMTITGENISFNSKFIVKKG